MPGIAMDGSEDLPNDDIVSTNLCPEVQLYAAGDYLSQKLANAYGEIKILTDNTHSLNDKHVRHLIEINAMVSDLLYWQLIDKEEREGN